MYQGAEKPRCLIVVALLITTLWSGAAQADPVAAALYEEGVTLMKERAFDKACPKLQASFDREPLSGTLMVVGQCHELSGKSATAWDAYKRAATLAHNEKRAEYEAKAKELADAVEPKLSRLTIIAESPQASGAVLAVSLDDKPISAATFGLAIALDPGRHTLEATAPGYGPWSRAIEIAGESSAVTVEVPALEAVEPEPQTPAPEPPSPAEQPPKPTPAALPPHEEEASGVPTWAWVAGGIGLASAVVSFAFLGVNRGAAGELDEQCGGKERLSCPQPAEYDAQSDHDTEKLSSGMFIGFGIGAIVGVGVGLAGILVGSSGDDDSARIVPMNLPSGGGLLYVERF